MSKKHSEKSLLARSTGGNGFYLPASVAFDSDAYGERAMNIDLLDDTDGTTFSVLKGMDKDGEEIDLLEVFEAPFDKGLMGVFETPQPAGIRNFTWGLGFTKITADKDVFINIVNNI